MPKITDLTGNRYGKLVVLEKTEQREARYVVWRCRCDCGRECMVNTKHLQRGTITDCGCVPKTNAKRGNIAEDLTGQVFGELTALSRVENKKGHTRWLCQCTCGQKKIVTARSLKAGKTKSCGGMQHQIGRSIADIAGRRFGRLTAISPTRERNKNMSVCWNCRCDCGKEVVVSEDALASGNCKSCGCLKREVQENVPNMLHRIDGTCVEHLEKRKYRNDNTSGFRGVTLQKDGGYRVTIGFKGRRYYVGKYKTFGAAVAARMEAENIIHEGFVNAYYMWKQKAEEDPDWEKKHPLIFEVEKIEGKFHVTTNIY